VNTVSVAPATVGSPTMDSLLSDSFACPTTFRSVGFDASGFFTWICRPRTVRSIAWADPTASAVTTRTAATRLICMCEGAPLSAGRRDTIWKDRVNASGNRPETA
jgi:hypothetical protein